MLKSEKQNEGERERESVCVRGHSKMGLFLRNRMKFKPLTNLYYS